MRFGRDLPIRLRRAAALNASPWISAFALIVGAFVAWLLASAIPKTGSDVVAAKTLGIVSISILAGYSKSADSLAYALALFGAIATGLFNMVGLANMGRPQRTWTIAASPLEYSKYKFAGIFRVRGDCVRRIWTFLERASSQLQVVVRLDRRRRDARVSGHGSARRSCGP